MTTGNAERARLTADVILFGIHDGLHVLLIRRAWDPHKGLYALPGGHLDVGEKPEAAARRELSEETGLAVPPRGLELLGVYSNPGRDPRGRYVTWAYNTTVLGLPTPKAGDDAATAEWLPVDQALALRLAFDHGEILRDAVDRNRRRSEQALVRLADQDYPFAVEQLHRAAVRGHAEAIADDADDMGDYAPDDD